MRIFVKASLKKEIAPGKRPKAFQKLKDKVDNFKKRRNIRKLIKDLGSWDDVVCKEAIYKLVEIGRPALPQLEEESSRNKNEIVRENARKVIGKIVKIYKQSFKRRRPNE